MSYWSEKPEDPWEDRNYGGPKICLRCGQEGCSGGCDEIDDFDDPNYPPEQEQQQQQEETHERRDEHHDGKTKTP